MRPVSKLARETGVGDRARTFSPWSHTVSLLEAQLSHCIGLNDLCDSLQLHSGPLSTIRGATPPSRNGLSHANRERSPAVAEKLFWRSSGKKVSNEHWDGQSDPDARFAR